MPRAGPKPAGFRAASRPAEQQGQLWGGFTPRFLHTSLKPLRFLHGAAQAGSGLVPLRFGVTRGFGALWWGCVRGEGDTRGAVTGGAHSGAGGWCVWGGRSVGQKARPIGPGHAVSVGWVSVGWVSVGGVPMGVGVHGVNVCGAEGLWDRRPSLWDQDSLCPWGGWLWGLWGRRPSLWGQDTLCPWGGCL